METRVKQERVMSRADAVAMWCFMALGAAFAVWTVVRSILRIIEVIPNHDVRVYASFVGTMASAPIGPDGAAAPVELSSGWVIAPDLPIASVVALIVQQLIIIAAVSIVITSLLMLMWNVVRGRVFSKRNTRLVSTAGFATIIGIALTPFFGNMVANGAFARISDRTFDNVVGTLDVTLLVGAAFLAALASFVFTIGARLQRETELLV